jgi:hypothetical protein
LIAMKLKIMLLIDMHRICLSSRDMCMKSVHYFPRKYYRTNHKRAPVNVLVVIYAAEMSEV